jgi:hypothetical protein
MKTGYIAFFPTPSNDINRDFRFDFQNIRFVALHRTQRQVAASQAARAMLPARNRLSCSLMLYDLQEASEAVGLSTVTLQSCNFSRKERPRVRRRLFVRRVTPYCRQMMIAEPWPEASEAARVSGVPRCGTYPDYDAAGEATGKSAYGSVSLGASDAAQGSYPASHSSVPRSALRAA